MWTNTKSYILTLHWFIVFIAIGQMGFGQAQWEPWWDDQLSKGYFMNGLAIVRQDRKFGVINELGELVVPCNYLAIDRSIMDCQDYFKAKSEEGWGVIDKADKVLIPFQFQTAGDIKWWRAGKDCSGWVFTPSNDGKYQAWHLPTGKMLPGHFLTVTNTQGLPLNTYALNFLDNGKIKLIGRGKSRKMPREAVSLGYFDGKRGVLSLPNENVIWNKNGKLISLGGNRDFFRSVNFPDLFLNSGAPRPPYAIFNQKGAKLLELRDKFYLLDKNHVLAVKDGQYRLVNIMNGNAKPIPIRGVVHHVRPGEFIVSKTNSNDSASGVRFHLYDTNGDSFGKKWEDLTEYYYDDGVLYAGNGLDDGAIDFSGDLKIAPGKYRGLIKQPNWEYWTVSQGDDQWGIIDSEEHTILELSYNMVSSISSSGYFYVRQKNMSYQIKHVDGRKTKPFTCDEILLPIAPPFLVRKGNKKYFVDENGLCALNCEK